MDKGLVWSGGAVPFPSESATIREQKLQTALHAKAKAEAGYRFYALLYDKISREDINTTDSSDSTSSWIGS
jgi:hypothetical protein